MISKVDPADYGSIRHFFDELYQSLPIEAIIAGNSKATIWIDNASSPRATFVWDRAHCYYFGGDGTNNEFNNELRSLLAEFVIPDSITRGRRVFKLYYTNEGWESVLPTVFVASTLTKRARQFYALPDCEFQEISRCVSEDVRVEQVSNSILHNTKIGNVGCMCEEILSSWQTIEEFLNIGFGYCVVQENDIVCWCLAEYVSGRKCGIGIETVQPYEKRGFATLAATAFISHCLSHGIAPHWDSWADNIGSIRVAEKVGFRKVLDYSVYYGQFTG
ncbi:MAG: GNAT family N-acetyltransferase [Armatimonadetes bacterium]|nr:GNAT family N-acetyltransferase [Armatimonadota bacterium]